ncbi:MAG: hypothetical protein LBM59_06260 [Ruminococcus sp.]|jgi:hypothetical protein|nr:hypothetical protein [Ruminococcus sp.]
MVSEKFMFSDNSEEYANIPLKIEEFVEFAGLAPDRARIMSLLSEEMIGMFRAILPDFSADIWAERDGKTYEITASVNAVITTKDRDNLLKATDGKNAALRSGILGKMGEMIINWAIELNDNPVSPISYADMEMGMGMGMNNAFDEWSMRTYLDATTYKKDDAVLTDDGLERSIIVKLADDCKMSVKSGSVRMTVSKTF